MADRVRFYTDEHVAHAVALGLRWRGIDVRTALEAGMLGADDRAHLAFASEEGRVPFTQDEDFLALDAAGVPHAGIAYARQHTPIGRLRQGLALIHDVLEPSEAEGRVEFL